MYVVGGVHRSPVLGMYTNALSGPLWTRAHRVSNLHVLVLALENGPVLWRMASQSLVRSWKEPEVRLDQE